MKIQLVADSAANVTSQNEMGVVSAALKIVTDKTEYVDNDALDVARMVAELKAYKGKSTTACPSVQEWKEAFGDADMVFGVAITSGLSGSYNAGCIAAREYMEENPGRKAYIVDSRSTGPEMVLLLEKLHELAGAGLSFEEICTAIEEYHKHTRLYYALSSLDNLAKNGRVSPIVAKAVGLLGIRVVGTTTPEGTLHPEHKCRGEKKAMEQMLACMVASGYKGGKVRLTHSCAPEVAEKFFQLLKANWPNADITIGEDRGLCCFYAEEGSFLSAFEHE